MRIVLGGRRERKDLEQQFFVQLVDAAPLWRMRDHGSTRVEWEVWQDGRNCVLYLSLDDKQEVRY